MAILAVRQDPRHPVAQPGRFRRSFVSATEWQLSSGILQGQGGVARYYQTNRKTYAPVSHEITAYFLGSLLYSHRISLETRPWDKSLLVSRALDIASYLDESAWHSQEATFPFEPIPEGQPAFAYFFDCGIILRGLIAAWRTTQNPRFLSRAVETASAMSNDFVRPDRIDAILQLPGKHPVSQGNRWSQAGGCYQLKAALGWRELAEATGQPKWKQLYLDTLERCLATHRQFLNAEAISADAMDRLHAYCYFLEGLLPEAVDASDRGRRASEALRWGIRLVNNALRDVSPVLLRSDVCAQLLRIRLYADGLGILPLDIDHAEEEVNLIYDFQAQHTDRRINGGFYFGRESAGLRPFVNPVSTAFSIQALALWEDYCCGRLQADPSTLI